MRTERGGPCGFLADLICFHHLLEKKSLLKSLLTQSTFFTYIPVDGSVSEFLPFHHTYSVLHTRIPHHHVALIAVITKFQIFIRQFSVNNNCTQPYSTLHVSEEKNNKNCLTEKRISFYIVDNLMVYPETDLFGDVGVFSVLYYSCKVYILCKFKPLRCSHKSQELQTHQGLK